MGLFDQVLDAVNDRNRAGSPGQMDSIFGAVQQVSQTLGLDPSKVQSLLSLVGGHVRSSLQRQRTADGDDGAQAIVEECAGDQPNPQAVSRLFSPNEQENLAQDAAQKTGLNAGLIQQLLPMLVPLVLNFLKTGASSQGRQAGGNSVLNAFLDADHDGDVDLADVMNLASRHFGRH